MSILTPDTVYGFPYVGYIQSQIGHTMILMGVFYAMIIDKQRPYLSDVFKALFYASILLIFSKEWLYSVIFSLFDKTITDSIITITPTTGINVIIEIFPIIKNK